MRAEQTLHSTSPTFSPSYEDTRVDGHLLHWEAKAEANHCILGYVPEHGQTASDLSGCWSIQDRCSVTCMCCKGLLPTCIWAGAHADQIPCCSRICLQYEVMSVRTLTLTSWRTLQLEKQTIII